MAGKKAARYFSTCHPYDTRRCRRPFFRLFYRAVRFCVPRHRVEWAEGAPPEEPCVFVCNHARAYGPLSMCTRFPRSARPWVIADMCFVRRVPAYARIDFWPGEGPFRKAMAWVLSYLIAPIAPWLMIGVEAIPVYHDSRVLETFRKSIQTLREGKDIILFPEVPDGKGLYLDRFADGFVLLGRRWATAAGKPLRFYPVFADRRNRTFHVGAPVTYDPAARPDAERTRICQALHAALKDMRGA